MSETYAQRAIRHIRKLDRLSCEQIAEHCGVSRQALYKWINGGACLPHNEERLGELLKITKGKARARQAEKLSLHLREAETHLALAIGVMGGLKSNIQHGWPNVLGDYQKMVRQLLRVKAIADEVDKRRPLIAPNTRSQS